MFSQAGLTSCYYHLIHSPLLLLSSHRSDQREPAHRVEVRAEEMETVEALCVQFGNTQIQDMIVQADASDIDNGILAVQKTCVWVGGSCVLLFSTGLERNMATRSPCREEIALGTLLWGPPVAHTIRWGKEKPWRRVLVQKSPGPGIE